MTDLTLNEPRSRLVVARAYVAPDEHFEHNDPAWVEFTIDTRSMAAAAKASELLDLQAGVGEIVLAVEARWSGAAGTVVGSAARLRVSLCEATQPRHRVAIYADPIDEDDRSRFWSVAIALVELQQMYGESVPGQTLYASAAGVFLDPPDEMTALHRITTATAAAVSDDEQAGRSAPRG